MDFVILLPVLISLCSVSSPPDVAGLQDRRMGAGWKCNLQFAINSMDCNHTNHIAILCSSAIQLQSRFIVLIGVVFGSIVPQSGMVCKRGPILMADCNPLASAVGLPEICNSTAIQYRRNLNQL